jgi:hypothetical protein
VDFATLAERFGLPVAVLAAFVVLVIRGDLVPRVHVKNVEEESLYRDRLRAEERADRLASQRELDAMADTLGAAARALSELAGLPDELARLSAEVKALRADIRRRPPGG